MAALVQASMARNAPGSVAIANGFGAQSEQPNIAGSWRNRRDALRIRNAAARVMTSQRARPVGRRPGSARTRIARAMS